MTSRSSTSPTPRPTARSVSPPAPARAIPPIRRPWDACCWRSSRQRRSTRTSSAATFSRLTQFTETNPEELRRILDGIRVNGYATVQDELDYGLVSVAVPIVGPTGRVVAAANSSDVTNHVDQQALLEKRLPALRLAVRRIESTLLRHPELANSVESIPGRPDATPGRGAVGAALGGAAGSASRRASRRERHSCQAAAYSLRPGWAGLGTGLLDDLAPAPRTPASRHACDFSASRSGSAFVIAVASRSIQAAAGRATRSRPRPPSAPRRSPR